MDIRNVSCCYSNPNKDTAKNFGTKITLLLVLLDILFTNTIVCYTVIKTQQKGFHWKITASNFVANILYGIGRITRELDNKARSNSVVHFLENVGQTMSLLGIGLLVILQLRRLQSLNVNNKIVYFQGIKDTNNRRVNFALILLWVSSTFLSAGCFSFEVIIVQYVQISINLVAISLTIIVSIRILTIIKRHKRSIHCLNTNQLSNKTNNLEKPLRFLKGTITLLILCWLPALVGKLVLLIIDHRMNLNFKWLKLSGLSYPVLYPILYVSCNKAVRRYILKHWIKCKSKEDEKVEDFYAKLKNYKQHRRSMHMKPFILTTEI